MQTVYLGVAMTVNFTVMGEPKGKGRPRFSNFGGVTRTYTPENTVIYENQVKIEYMQQSGHRFSDTSELEMHIKAFFTIPKSTSKKKKAEMESGKIRPTKKPDVDNILKTIADSLNQIAYRDDAQIINCSVKKYYSEVPRVEVEIRGN